MIDALSRLIRSIPHVIASDLEKLANRLVFAVHHPEHTDEGPVCVRCLVPWPCPEATARLR